MATTTARNKQDVDNMDARERLYDSLNYSYDKKGEKLAEQYDKAKVSADLQALGRGMQRSSYNNQVLANLDQQKINALDDNWNQFIADYENRIADIENQEWQKDFQERQFAETQRQYDTGLAWQKEQADIANSQWEREYASGLSSNDRQIALNNIYQIAAQGNDPSDELLAAAGLSRADFNAMKAQIVAEGGGSGGGGYSGGSYSGDSPSDTSTEDTTSPANWLSILNGVGGANIGQSASAYNSALAEQLAKAKRGSGGVAGGKRTNMTK